MIRGAQFALFGIWIEKADWMGYCSSYDDGRAEEE